MRFATDPLAEHVSQEQEAEHRKELRDLSDLAYVFLSTTDNDKDQAVNMLDNTIGLLMEGGVLSMWRYRLLLNYIREGL